MLPIINIFFLVFNAWLLFNLATKPEPKTVTTADHPDEQKLIEMIAELKAELATKNEQPLMQSKVEYPDAIEPAKKIKIEMFCIEHQLTYKAGDHYWTWINSETGKPFLCTPGDRRTLVKTIKLDFDPNELREDLVDP